MAVDPLTSIEALIDKQASRPPIEGWHPEISGDIDIVIKSNGQWFHEAGLISRERLVRLFASILRREDDLHYYLVTPVEKWRIRVEETAYLAVDFNIENEGEADESIVFTTNIGEQYSLSKAFPLQLLPDDAQPCPILTLDRGLSAKLTRNCFYGLVGHAKTSGDELVVRSEGLEFSLGALS